MGREDIREVLRKLEKAEQDFAGRLVVAPVVSTRRIAVRISGIWCRLLVEGLPDGFRGYGVFESLSVSAARFLREASLAERHRLLDALPAVRLLALPDEAGWPANSGDTRFRFPSPVPLLLADSAPALFETVVARFDGRVSYFDRLDPAKDPSLAAFLREQLLAPDPVAPEALRKKGLTREERAAYGELRQRRLESERSEPEKRLRRALGHGGAELLDYSEATPGFYTVRFRLSGSEHVSAVRVSDLTLVSAGICLAGEETKFDLASLASVLREACEDE
ncbi:MAG: hypothetical protein L6R30_04210 [Thermoanaerobaculia bacterium]|nr:hypothetical protein [Thermoanaerobaculia bacterium]